MRLLLEITSGPDAGRKAWLREGQVLEVGRTDLATFTVPHDSRMSGRHFAVRLDRQGCQLQDLGSRNGTLVNNNRVSETVLRDRDVIVAGETRFVVQLQGADAMASPASSRATPASTPAVSPPVRPAIPPASVPATVAASRFGRWLCRAAPANWLSDERGLRLVTANGFPSSLVFSEFPAPDDVPLDRFVHAQVEQFVQSLTGAEIEGPAPMRIDGAEEGMQFTLRHPPQGGFILLQRYVYARRENIFGMAVLTTSYADLQGQRREFEQLLSGLAFQGKAQSPRVEPPASR